MYFDKKYRPKNLSQFIGNSIIKKIIRTFPSDPPSLVLLHGKTGCGKTTLARIIVDMFDYQLTDFNIADAGGIDLARYINSSAKVMSMRKKGKIYLLDETQGANKNCMNALLKITEEPPKNTIFIMATTEPQHLLSAIRSRALKLEVKPLTEKQSIILLSRVCKQENLDFDKRVLTNIHNVAEGIPRQELIILNSIAKLENQDDIDELILQIELEGLGSKQLIDLCRALLNLDSFKHVMAILRSLEDKPETIRRVILDYMNKVLLNGRMDKQAAMVLCSFIDCKAIEIGLPAITNSIVNLYF
ncbi:MAG: hypothetical protein BV456_08405 [Thermoplasmata archaeon M8B2D]|nr:MAG: hypothetical protein BV456_08405 [Thermoplasmata archaeon M8B2D]